MLRDIELLGDPHLGRVFRNNVPLHRRGEREAMIWRRFEREIRSTEQKNTARMSRRHFLLEGKRGSGQERLRPDRTRPRAELLIPEGNQVILNRR